jgi:hypothetical protein
MNNNNNYVFSNSSSIYSSMDNDDDDNDMKKYVHKVPDVIKNFNPVLNSNGNSKTSFCKDKKNNSKSK